MAVVSLLVWLDSPGSVIFAQERIGLNGKIFRIFKFRKFPITWGDEGPGVTTRNDPRMTTIGAILERTKLDELPQLWNILRGEMSFVGPRPESIRFADLFKGEYAELLNYIPGLLGPNQIVFRNENELYVADEDPDSYYRRVLFPQKAERDLAYFRNAHCLHDILFIIRGVQATLFGLVNWRRFARRQGKILILDTILIAVAWMMANIFRFTGIPQGRDFDVIIKGFPIILPLMVAGLLVGGCYSSPPKYFSLPSALRLSLVVLITWLSTFLVLIKIESDVSLYLAPMTTIILLILLGLPRVLSRVQWEKSLAEKSNETERILIYGAGKTGVGLASCFGNGQLVGFVDDDPYLRNNRIKGYKVFGHESDFPTIHKVHHFGQLWVTFQPAIMQRTRLEKFCKSNDVKLLILPELEPFSTLYT